MSKKVGLLTTLLVLGLTTVAMAADAGAGDKAEGIRFFVYSAVAAGFAIAIAAFGCGIGQGMAVKGAVEGIARNPDASGKVTVTMLIGLAMIINHMNGCVNSMHFLKCNSKRFVMPFVSRDKCSVDIEQD